MDLDNAIKEFRETLQELNEAITAMERLAKTQERKRRGRPPKWLIEQQKKAQKKKKKKR